MINGASQEVLGLQIVQQSIQGSTLHKYIIGHPGTFHFSFVVIDSPWQHSQQRRDSIVSIATPINYEKLCK